MDRPASIKPENRPKASPAAPRRTARGAWRWLAVALLATALAACGRAPDPNASSLAIVSARATSQTSIEVTFDRAVDESGGVAANYRVAGPDGGLLPVLAAYVAQDGTRVTLATEPQQLVTYALTVSGVRPRGGPAPVAGITAQGGFGGSGEVAPIVASAIALSNTEVLITFADPTSAKLSEMGDGALNPAYYEIAVPGLEVLGAAYADNGKDRSRVILTTSSMSDLVYTVKVTNVLSAQGSKLVDPFVNTAQFRGITKGDAVAPTVKDVFVTGNTTIVIQFSEPVGDDAADPSKYLVRDPDGAPLPVVAAVLNDVRTEVTLTTWPMTAGVTYVVEVVGVTDRNGNPIEPNETTFQGAPVDASDDQKPPRVMGANSTGNTTVVVTFDEPVMGGPNGAEDPQKYTIVDRDTVDAMAPQAVVLVTEAKLSASQRSVTLTTLAQSEIVYALTVTDVTDLVGNQIAPPDRDHPFQTTFFGTGPVGSGNDADDDGLSDAAEQAGWTVTVRLANGETTRKQVTSDPNVADTDGDGLSDADERAYLTNPRAGDTDGDQLSDYWELNYVYSDPTNQDGDGDGLMDGLEWWFFRTSPNLADTDGDQIDDGDEINLGNRNPRLADLPRPGIEIGEVDLQLDVRFSATSQRGTRELESNSYSSTLSQSEAKSTSNTDSNTQSFSIKAGVEIGWKAGVDFGAAGKFSVETGYSGEWSSSFTRESSQETQRAYERSTQSEAELEIDETLTREVEGASMKLGVNLRSLGDIAFTISNVQITAFIQDARMPQRLIPIATLVPEAEPASGYNLGPLVQERGPLVFVADQVFPAQIERLMRDPTGLTFKISNFDITDEFGRNFAFTSQDVNDRTASIVIDYGAADTDGDGEGDLTERLKVSTSSGRVALDTDGDGDVDDEDERVLYDANGRQVGIVLSEALELVLGLTHYDEDDTPSASLTQAQRDASYSTRTVNGVERLWRVRNVSQDGNPLKRWWALTPEGILDQDQEVRSRVLLTGQGITLAFVQDLDDDGVPATVEYTHGCSDTQADTDGDGMDDRFEAYVGWTVSVQGRGDYQGYASCARVDSDRDGMDDDEERDLGTDAKLPDTDGDGLTDFEEVNGFNIDMRFGSDLFGVTTDPLDPDTDGDTLPDGAERDLGTDPNTDDGDMVFDDDGDGLVNFQETSGWSVTTVAVSTSPNVEGVSATKTVTSDPDVVDTDGDGLDDKAEADLGTDPTQSDSDGDGLSDAAEVALGTDPLDADTDDDMRSDGAEVNDALAIDVAGADAYTVKSDPLVADEDNDGLVDGEEATLGTDPKLFDTDGDGGGLGDGEEATICLGTTPDVCRDALTPDQKLTVTYRIEVARDGDVDAAGGSGEFWYTLAMKPGSTTISNDGNKNLNDNANVVLWTKSIIRPLSEAMSVSVDVYEWDEAGSPSKQCQITESASFNQVPLVVDATHNKKWSISHVPNDIINACVYSIFVEFAAE